MNVKLYVVHGSHPCATVQRALELKGIPYKLVELPPPMHMAVMKLRFGQRTVPGISIDGEKLVGSRAILRRLDALRPEPALLPADPAARAAVEAAEAWGDDVLQPLARRVLWPTFAAHPEAMACYSEGSKLPPVPLPVLKLMAPVVTGIEMRANHASKATYPADLRQLPEQLDRIDAWLADGTLGGEQPNAADLQIAPSVCLLMTLGDLRPLIASRPAGVWAAGLFPDFPGDAPAGLIPAELIGAAPAAA